MSNSIHGSGGIHGPRGPEGEQPVPPPVRVEGRVNKLLSGINQLGKISAQVGKAAALGAGHLFVAGANMPTFITFPFIGLIHGCEKLGWHDKKWAKDVPNWVAGALLLGIPPALAVIGNGLYQISGRKDLKADNAKDFLKMSMDSLNEVPHVFTVKIDRKFRQMDERIRAKQSEALSPSVPSTSNDASPPVESNRRPQATKSPSFRSSAKTNRFSRRIPKPPPPPPPPRPQNRTADQPQPNIPPSPAPAPSPRPQPALPPRKPTQGPSPTTSPSQPSAKPSSSGTSTPTATAPASAPAPLLSPESKQEALRKFQGIDKELRQITSGEEIGSGLDEWSGFKPNLDNRESIQKFMEHQKYTRKIFNFLTERRSQVENLKFDVEAAKSTLDGIGELEELIEEIEDGDEKLNENEEKIKDILNGLTGKEDGYDNIEQLKDTVKTLKDEVKQTIRENKDILEDLGLGIEKYSLNRSNAEDFGQARGKVDGDNEVDFDVEGLVNAAFPKIDTFEKKVKNLKELETSWKSALNDLYKKLLPDDQGLIQQRTTELVQKTIEEMRKSQDSNVTVLSRAKHFDALQSTISIEKVDKNFHIYTHQHGKVLGTGSYKKVKEVITRTETAQVGSELATVRAVTKPSEIVRKKDRAGYDTKMIDGEFYKKHNEVLQELGKVLGIMKSRVHVIEDKSVVHYMERCSPLEYNELPIAERIKYGGQFLDALSAMHEKKYIHRDIKPENLLLNNEKKLVVGDLDFAIKVEKENIAETAGSLHTAAPEVLLLENREERWSDENLIKTDTYSAGITLFLLVTGTPETSLRGGESFRKLFVTEPPIIPANSDYHKMSDAKKIAFENLIGKMIERSPNKRPTDEIVKKEYMQFSKIK